ncbi:MAG: Unknown protein [uncultured Thiotrichaceae bacterium]|uniref:Uncharacterized protein n=1 Tax=uncultured Thiotrichaceae bacterium TaxID=298394 RepID=A0A6S6TUU6_9GAMM|nr:MAG: Unknown protein [uncultured Thiotrichaceae bacterium]
MLKKIMTLSAAMLVFIMSGAFAEFYVPSMDEIENRQENESRCKGYVGSVLELQKKNQQYQCGLTGALWNIDKQQQFEWCMGELEESVSAANAKRSEEIDACISRKTATTNPQNIPEIPAVCFHPDSRYKAVKSLHRAYRYQKSLEQPVENGLIRYDYNKDKKEDFVFLELHDHLAKVVVCFSAENTYRRQLTDIEFSARGDSVEGEQYRISQDQEILQVEISSLIHNTGSSFRQIEYRYHVAKQAFEIVKNHAESTPVYYDGVPSPMGTPRTPSLNVPQ